MKAEVPILTANDVASAIVAACRLTGEDAEQVVTRAARDARNDRGLPQKSRGALLAIEALAMAIPGVKKTRANRLLGGELLENVNADLKDARKTRWWDEDCVDEVVGAVLAQRGVE